MTAEPEKRAVGPLPAPAFIATQMDARDKALWVSANGGYTWEKMRGLEDGPYAFILSLHSQRRFDRCCHR